MNALSVYMYCLMFKLLKVANNYYSFGLLFCKNTHCHDIKNKHLFKYQLICYYDIRKTRQIQLHHLI